MLSEEAWEGLFKPIQTETGDLLSYQEALDKSPGNNFVWTVVESDNGKHQIVCPGIHTVNVMGFVITEVPWVHELSEGYWYYDDRTTYTVIGRFNDVVSSDDVDAMTVVADTPEIARAEAGGHCTVIYLLSVVDGEIVFH